MKRLLTNLVLLSILSVGIETLNAQTNVPSLITSSQVWTISGSPYLINQNTYIDSGVSVKIMPGVEVIALNNTIRLQIDGELQALGTVDSVILIQKLQIELNFIATPYDNAKGTGAYFRHCEFTSPGYGKRVIHISGISTRIQNCLFSDPYEGVYVYTSNNQSPPKIEIINCSFNDNTGACSPIMASGFRNEIHLLGNTFNNFKVGSTFQEEIYLECQMLLTFGNTFNGQKRILFHTEGPAFISCNYFSNLDWGLEVRSNFSFLDTVSSCIISHNTFDSTVFGAPMLKFNRLQRLNQDRFNYNNFLGKSGPVDKVHISGINSTPTSSESVNFKYNYWMTTDSATIDSMIKDYSDDINIFGRADFSGYLSQLDSTCGDSSIGSGCKASFYLALDTTTPNNLYVIHTSTGTSSNTSYTWDFGDGQTSNDPNPSHTYNDFGKYYLCVTLYNPLENCSSTYCDSIGIDSNGMLMKKAAFTIHVVDEDELTNIDQKDFFGDMRIYPNPTSGKLIIETSEEIDEPMIIQVFDLSGKVLYEIKNDGNQHFEIDLSDLQEGLYLLKLQKGQSIYTTKIVVNR